MADFDADPEIVAEFMRNTCTVCKLLYFDDLQALLYCAKVANVSLDVNDTGLTPTISGSVAEFYIQPMLSCVGDYDVMCYRSDELAIPAATAPPTDLPREFDSRVKIFEIVDDEFLGYVNLESCYLLTECIDDGEYLGVECERKVLEYELDVDSHGPASVTRWFSENSDDLHPGLFGRIGGSSFSRDDVYCMRCLSWPTQAVDWPTRTESTAGQTQQLLIVLSATVVMWFVWHIVGVEGMIGIYSIDCHSHEQKLNC